MHTWVLVIAGGGLCTAVTAQGAPECLSGQERLCAREAQVGHWEEFLRGKGCQSLAGASQGGGGVPIPEVFRGCLDLALNVLLW